MDEYSGGTAPKLARAAGRFPVGSWVAACIIAVTACEPTAPVENAEPVEPAPVLTWQFAPAERQGILSPTTLSVVVRDSAGTPRPDVEVEWTVTSGSGLVGTWYVQSPASPPLELAPVAVAVSGHNGIARTSWLLGPVPGVQQLTVGAPGAEPLVAHIEATPGVVFVAVWNLTEEQQARLPSDTLRLHVTNHERIDPAVEEFEPGAVMSVVGAMRRGAALDANWVFHLDPRHTFAAAGLGSVPECIPLPPLTTAELDAVLDPGSNRFMLCPGRLRLVGIEPVPGWYLERLSNEGG